MVLAFSFQASPLGGRLRSSGKFRPGRHFLLLQPACNSNGRQLYNSHSVTGLSASLSIAEDPTPLVQSATSFEPVLDAPALGSFLVILVIFGLLQSRISAIGQAADRRTAALEELRAVKSRQLSGEATEDDVKRATEFYREAYETVENLRTVIPGVARIPPPPADTLSRDRMDDNAAAAQQFLGIEDVEDVTAPARTKGEEGGGGLAPPLIAVLVVVAVSQIVLLGFLSLDPMTANNALDSVGSVVDI